MEAQDLGAYTGIMALAIMGTALVENMFGVEKRWLPAVTLLIVLLLGALAKLSGTLYAETDWLMHVLLLIATCLSSNGTYNAILKHSVPGMAKKSPGGETLLEAVCSLASVFLFAALIWLIVIVGTGCSTYAMPGKGGIEIREEYQDAPEGGPVLLYDARGNPSGYAEVLRSRRVKVAGQVLDQNATFSARRSGEEDDVKFGYSSDSGNAVEYGRVQLEQQRELYGLGRDLAYLAGQWSVASRTLGLRGDLAREQLRPLGEGDGLTDFHHRDTEAQRTEAEGSSAARGAADDPQSADASAAERASRAGST